ncbi:MAG: hypothetical protein GYB67_01650 [Chloroflexi bacterium]|nr:hypothetical protein [Chloroflexota bacterium]
MMPDDGPHIGRLHEGSLHAALKQIYARPGDQLETRVGGYVIDIVRPESDPPLLIEIQTRGFANLKRKLAALLADYPLRIVHPIAQEKWIVRLDADGQQVSRRKSPRRAGVEYLFGELVAFPHLIGHTHLTLDVLLTQEEEIWRDDGQGSWRRKGWSISDRRLLGVLDQIPLATHNDFRLLLPPDLPAVFTSADLAAAAKLKRPLAQKMIYCLRTMGVITAAGKQGRATRYTITAG